MCYSGDYRPRLRSPLRHFHLVLYVTSKTVSGFTLYYCTSRPGLSLASLSITVRHVRDCLWLHSLLLYVTSGTVSGFTLYLQLVNWCPLQGKPCKTMRGCTECAFFKVDIQTFVLQRNISNVDLR